MLPVQAVEELISESYVCAVIASSGSVPNSIRNDYGIDLEVRRIKEIRRKRIDCGAYLALQLKASINWSLEDDYVVYDLDADALNRLVEQREHASLPCVLILCCLPEDATTWVEACEDQLTIQKCCYYHFIEESLTNNSSSRRIRIPRSQLFTVDGLSHIEKVFRERAA